MDSQELDTSCLVDMDDSEDKWCNQAVNVFEHQGKFQSHLLTQSGNGLQPDSEGMFEFELQPFVDLRSDKMGVWQRHFTARLWQTNNFVDIPHLATAIQQALQTAISCVLDNNIADNDRLFVTLVSNRLSNNYTGWGLPAGKWRHDGQQVDEILQHLAKALNSNEQFEMDDSFELSVTQVRQPPRGNGRKRQTKPGHQHPQAFQVFMASRTKTTSVVPVPSSPPKPTWTNTGNTSDLRIEGRFRRNMPYSYTTTPACLWVVAGMTS